MLGFLKGHAVMIFQVCSCLFGIPGDFHDFIVCTKVCTVKVCLVRIVQVPPGVVHTHFQTVVKDGETIIFVGKIRAKDDYQLSDEHGKEATGWLEEHFPDWWDEMAYWD